MTEQNKDRKETVHATLRPEDLIGGRLLQQLVEQAHAEQAAGQQRELY